MFTAAFTVPGVLVFLGMVTSRYAEEDFSLSLPLKMIIGHYTLFFSIATMMIAFCAGLFIMLPENHGWSFLSFALLVLLSSNSLLCCFPFLSTC
ncbi:hypothetical protein SLA2020_282480 [Shorea laevis]